MTAPEFPSGRYGRRREPATSRRWLVPVLAALSLLVALGLAVVAYRNQNNGVQATVTGFSIAADNVRISFQVRRPANRAVLCVLRARNVRGTEVGRAEVPIPAGPSSIALSYTLATSGRAVTGEVYGCAPQPG